MTDTRSSLFAASGPPDLDQDTLYLKWDLQRFLNGKDSELLPPALIDQIGRAIAQLAAYKHDHDECGAPATASIVMLKATATAIQRTLSDIAAAEAQRDGSVTPRKQLIRGDLTRTLARITHLLSQLGSPSPSRVP